ncbi:hypothetical protein [Falsirhodobacter sp. alg1]|uniref:hypothetical protein n=1 Tax=Falsirhodobacter sp. alg1 TaxID=1472418 RepID=UPI0005EFB385|nr:hypothetical protein [Falsirhodobacter sp. alg1]
MNWMRWVVLGSTAIVVSVALNGCDVCLGTGSCQPAPDPDRTGGPRWLLDASVAERVDYYGKSCDANPYMVIGNPDTPPLSREACIEVQIKEAVHSACMYTAPSTFSGDVTLEQRTAAWQQCEAEALKPHDF